MKLKKYSKAYKFVMVVIHILGIMFSLFSLIFISVRLFNINYVDIKTTRFIDFFVTRGMLIGLLLISIIVLILRRNKREMIIGFIYLIIWILNINFVISTW